MLDRNDMKTALVMTPECLSPVQLEALLNGKHSDPHLAACPRCQAELAMLKSFESGTPVPGEGAAVAWMSAQLEQRLEAIKNPALTRRNARVRVEEQGSWLARIFGLSGMRWAIPVAAMAAIALASAVLLQSNKAPELQANVGGEHPIYRSQELQLAGPVGNVEKVPSELRWQTYAGAAVYRVSVMEVDRSALWTSETKDGLVELPAAVRSKVLPGKTILWQVTALDAQGKPLATSQIQRFVLSGGNASSR